MDCINILQEALKVKVLSCKKKLSLRNNVFYVETVSGDGLKRPYIIKEHLHSSNGDEVFFLSTLKRYGLNVPEIIWHDSRFVIMQYIRGTLLTDLLASPGGDQELWIEQLADWLKKLHGFINSSSRVCLCKSDLNLRNFIFDGREFYGLDFEDVCFYPPERDLGGICAFILNNDPMFEQWKYQICSSLIKAYERAPVNNCFTELDLEAIWYYLIEELKAAASRREKQRDFLNGKIKEMIALQKTSAGLKDFLIGS